MRTVKLQKIGFGNVGLLGKYFKTAKGTIVSEFLVYIGIQTWARFDYF